MHLVLLFYLCCLELAFDVLILIRFVAWRQSASHTFEGLRFDSEDLASETLLTGRFTDELFSIGN